MNTPEDTQFAPLKITESQKVSFQFGVQTCDSAVLGLSDSSTGQILYEITIGKMQSAIRKASQSKPQVIEQTAGTSCNEVKYFWISWRGGVIQVGRGVTTGDQIFMWWADPDIVYFNTISVQATKKAKWHFSSIDGKFNFPNTPSGDYVIFFVAAICI